MTASPTVRRILRTTCHVLPLVAPGTPLSEVIVRVVHGEILASGPAREVAAADAMVAVVNSVRIRIARDPARIVDDWAANRSPREVRRALAQIVGDHELLRQLDDEDETGMERAEARLEQIADSLTERGGLDG